MCKRVCLIRVQVQLRIHQIIESPDEEKKNLLKNLEEFAFKGIPNVYTNCSLNHLLVTTVSDFCL